MAPHSTDLFRKLPSTDELLRSPEIQALVARDGLPAVTAAVRNVLDRIRLEMSRRSFDAHELDFLLARLPSTIEGQLRSSLTHSLCAVINATGVILHTNLGRAPLSDTVIDHIREIATNYSNLEFDLSTGDRGKRDSHVDNLFQQIFATSESTTDSRAPRSTIVVNNNAAAVLLALNSLAEGGEVIVSRGELVEIGGSFRIPDVMSKSGAILREVGTTNRTRIADYERSLSDRTRLLLRVHRSNFEISGFTEQTSLEELVAFSHRCKIPLMEDLGSGALFDLRSVGVQNEPGVRESLALGVDIVSYSGDKLLGGPQAGLITGRSDLIARMRSNSLFRALRVDKLTYAALEATLLSYLRKKYDSIPAVHMIQLSVDSIRRRAEVFRQAVSDNTFLIELRDGDSLIGGGAAPSATLPTCLLAIQHRYLSAADLTALFRQSDPPIISRIEEDRVLLDLRTVLPEQDQQLISAFAKIQSVLPIDNQQSKIGNR
ncbi:MAG TPA: L-seryl-tRNA(Sec) selenium transferase [Terriglobales bacterium]|nr:L-seryl-tRNA(Sec) selenium transferase [Terriglobales bacterium]